MCVFTMEDVQNAFNGLYKEVNRDTQQWYTVTHSVPTPRPGAVRAWLRTLGLLLESWFCSLDRPVSQGGTIHLVR